MVEMLEWVREHDALVGILGGVSLLAFFGSLIVIPILVVRIPADYFVGAHREGWSFGGRHPILRYTLSVLKSVFGIMFVLAGIAMLALPGQGVLTILIGILLLDFPGKYRFECWLVTRRFVSRSINGLRRRARKPPLRRPRNLGDGSAPA